MGHLRRIISNGTDILVVDYSNSNEKEMIELFLEAKKAIISGNRNQPILSKFENTYVTSAFMNRARAELQDVLPFVQKQAMIGLNDPKRWILKGLNLFLKTDYRSFETEKEALDFLSGKP